MKARTALLCGGRILAIPAVILGFSVSLFAAPKKAPAPRPAPSAATAEEPETTLTDSDGAPAKDLLLPAESERKSDALATFVEGLIAEENADGEKALEAFQRVLNLDPGYTELAIKVAYEKARRGAVDEGINILKDTIKASPKDPLPHLYLSQLYSKYLRKPEPALKYAQQALDLDPANFAAYLALYELHSTAGQTKKAEAILDRASKVQSQDGEYWLQLAELYTRILLKDETAASAEDTKKLTDVLQKALATSRGDPVALAKIADFYVLARQVPQAIPLYIEVLKLRRNAPADLSIPNIQDKLARSFRATGQKEEAIAMLQQLIKENALRYEGYELLGELFDEKGDYEQALANYHQALLIDGSHPLNHLRVADMLWKTKQFDKAIEVLRETRRKFSQLPMITFSLARTLSQAKRYQEAVPMFEEALHEAEDRQQEILNAEFYFYYGAAAERAGLFEKAEQLLQKCIELEPQNAAEACNYLGYMWVERGEKLEEAGALIKRAIDAEPENAAFLDSWGWYYYKLGDYEKALEQLLKSAELMKPEDSVVFDHLADTYAKLNNIAQALVYWQKAVALEPENKEIAEKLEKAKQKMAARPSQSPPQ